MLISELRRLLRERGVNVSELETTAQERTLSHHRRPGIDDAVLDEYVVNAQVTALISKVEGLYCERG